MLDNTNFTFKNKLKSFLKLHFKATLAITLVVILIIVSLLIVFRPQKITIFNNPDEIRSVSLVYSQYELNNQSDYLITNPKPIKALNKLFDSCICYNSLRYGNLITLLNGDRSNSLEVELFRSKQSNGYFLFDITYTNGLTKQLYVFNGYGVLLKEEIPTDQEPPYDIKFKTTYYDMGQKGGLYSYDLYSSLLAFTIMDKVELIDSYPIQIEPEIELQY